MRSRGSAWDRLRAVSALAAVAGLAGSVAACSAQAAATAHASRSTTTITLVQFYSANAFTSVIKNFEKAYPTIKVQAQYVNPSTYSPQLQTALQAGSAADVIATDGGTGQGNSVLPLAQSHHLANLSGETWASTIPSAASALYTRGKGIYGLPLGGGLDGIVYNAALFKQLRLTVPKTFSQLLSMCAKVKAAGKAAFSVAGNDATYNLVEPAGNTVYGPQPNWNQLKSKHKVSFAHSAGWKKAMSEFTAMNSAGCYPAGAAGDTIPTAVSQVVGGQALGFIAPPGALSFIYAANPKFDVGVMPFPGPTAASTRAMVDYSDGLSVNAHAKHMKDAIKFVDFMARPSQDALWAKINGAISVANLAKDKVPSYDRSFLPLLKAGKTVSLPYLTWQGTLFNDVLPTGLEGVLAGSTSTSSLLGQMDQGW